MSRWASVGWYHSFSPQCCSPRRPTRNRPLKRATTRNLQQVSDTTATTARARRSQSGARLDGPVEFWIVGADHDRRIGIGRHPDDRPVPAAGGGRATTSTAGTGIKSQTIEFPTVSAPWAYGESHAVHARDVRAKVTLAASGACQVTNPDLGVLTATDVGECRVTASQPGGSGFTAAPPVTGRCRSAKRLRGSRASGTRASSTSGSSSRCR